MKLLNLDTHCAILTNLESLQAAPYSMDVIKLGTTRDCTMKTQAEVYVNHRQCGRIRLCSHRIQHCNENTAVPLIFSETPCSLGVALIDTLLLTCPMEAASPRKQTASHKHECLKKNISIHTTLKALKRVRLLFEIKSKVRKQATESQNKK